MNEKHARKLRLIYGIFLGVFTAVMGILLIVGAANIYFADPAGDPYSYELVRQRFMTVLAPVIIWLVAVIAGYVLSVVFPLAEKKPRTNDKRAALAKLRGRMPLGKDEQFLAERKRFKNFEITRLVIWSVCAAFGVLAAVMTIVYLADVSHFAASNVNAEIIAMLRGILPWIGSAFVLFIGATLYEHFSASRELNSMKKLIVLGKGYPLEVRPVVNAKNAVIEAMGSKKAVLIVRIAILAVGVAFVIAGILNGGMSDVLIKAIKICTECIGLG